MFELNSPVCIDESGFARPAKPGDPIWGYVCGLINKVSHKIPVSRAGAPDQVVDLYYDASRFSDDSKEIQAIYKALTKPKKKRKEKK